MSLLNFLEEKRCAGFDQCMPNTTRKNDGKMNERQEVMRATFNTYGHNSNRHLDSKDCKEEIREEEEEEGEKMGKPKTKMQRNSSTTCSFSFFSSEHFLRFSSSFFIIRFALLL